MSRMDQSQQENIQELLEVISKLESTEQCRAFFSDLCTVQELITLSQRLQVAKRLMAGETYDTIRSQIPVSSTTITRINTALEFGAGGYYAALGRERADRQK